MKALSFYCLFLLYIFIPLKGITQTLWSKAGIVILQPTDKIPEKIHVVGECSFKCKSVYVEEASFRNGLNTISKDAINKGANIIRLTELKQPNSWRTCWHIKAELYAADDISSVQVITTKIKDSTLGIADAIKKREAVIIVYRTVDNMDLGVDVFAGAIKIKRIKSGTYCKINVAADTVVTLYAGKDKAQNVIIRPEIGQAIFVKVKAVIRQSKVGITINGNGEGIPISSSEIAVADASQGGEEIRPLVSL